MPAVFIMNDQGNSLPSCYPMIQKTSQLEESTCNFRFCIGAICKRKDEKEPDHESAEKDMKKQVKDHRAYHI